MIRHFIYHQWLSAKRSNIWQKNLVMNLVIGFFLFIMIAYLLIFGMFIDKILQELAPDRDHVAVINSFLLYYFLMDLFFRFMMQSLPRINIESYLHLPISKKGLVHFMTSRTLTAVFNFLPLLIFIPAAVKVVDVQMGAQSAWIWILALIFLVFANSLLATYLKRQLGAKPLLVGIAGAAVAILITLDYFGVFSFSEISSWAFAVVLNHHYLLALAAAWFVFSYFLHYQFLYKRLYPDEVQLKKNRKLDNISNIRYLKSLGITGSIIALEMRLYWRNKRTRTIIYMMPVFLLYGLFFYPNPDYENAWGFLIFVGIFMTGGMMLNYANYAFAYESNYFDALLTKNIDIKKYIRVKYTIAVLISTLSFILTIPYVFFGPEILLINTMTFLYNIGVLSVALLYMSTYNKKRMDLSRGASFNYQGMGASNWLAMLPAFLLPVLIYAPFSFAGYPNAGLMFIGLLGILGLSFNRYLMDIVLRNFYSRKYNMADGFRQRN